MPNSFAYQFQVFGDQVAMGTTALGITAPDLIVLGTVIREIAELFGI